MKKEEGRRSLRYDSQDMVIIIGYGWGDVVVVLGYIPERLETKAKQSIA